MWNFWKKLLPNRQWNDRKIAFVAILVATSVAFILVFSTFAPFVALPSFKVGAGGLPVKLTGYIFGPFIGAITGVLSDLLSFAFRPINYHYFYTIAFACAGIIPGIIGYLFNRRWKYGNSAQAPQDEVRYNWINTIITLGILLLCMFAIVAFAELAPEEAFHGKKALITNRYVFMGIILAGSGSLFIGIFVFRFILRLKPKTFNAILPLIAFSAILEIVNVPLISLGDVGSDMVPKDQFMAALAGHFVLSPVKAWGNLIIILFAYKIIAPLIFNKTSNGWDTDTVEVKLPKSKPEKAADIKKARKGKK